MLLQQNLQVWWLIVKTDTIQVKLELCSTHKKDTPPTPKHKFNHLP